MSTTSRRAAEAELNALWGDRLPAPSAGELVVIISKMIAKGYPSIMKLILHFNIIDFGKWLLKDIAFPIRRIVNSRSELTMDEALYGHTFQGSLWCLVTENSCCNLCVYPFRNKEECLAAGRVCWVSWIVVEKGAVNPIASGGFMACGINRLKADGIPFVNRLYRDSNQL